MLEHFIKAAVETTSTFQETRTGKQPSVAHAIEVAEFSSAKEAVDRDLEHLLSSGLSAGENAVYSVHFSDLNGLSKLENNILAHEISVHLCKLIPNPLITTLRRSSKQESLFLHHPINHNQ